MGFFGTSWNFWIFLLQIGNWRRFIAVKNSLVSMDSQSLPV